jgi:7-carboxy-7-deazaguanine synthase
MFKSKIWIDEIFDSWQGEGYHAGKLTTFIRLHGCNVGCEWCDTGYGGIGDHLKPVAFNLVEIIPKINQPSVTITGGEPFMMRDNLRTLIEAIAIKYKNIQPHIAIETSGIANMDNPSRIFHDHWITFSPKDHVTRKTELTSHKWFWENYSELKIVIDTIDEFQFYLNKINWYKPIYVQPNWYNINSALDECWMICKLYPQVKLSLQTHKFIGRK